MSYDINFKVKVQDKDIWIPVGYCDANITWNVRDIITQSTGLAWLNEENNGLCVDIMPSIEKGLNELVKNPKKYEPLESPNGWGTVSGTIRFFRMILDAWHEFIESYETCELVDVVSFWIE